MTFKPSLTKLEGFKVGDSVKLRIVAVPEDHKAEIKSVSATEKAFRVSLKSKLFPEANGEWFWIWPNELEHV